jgi:hypothetical protein
MLNECYSFSFGKRYNPFPPEEFLLILLRKYQNVRGKNTLLLLFFLLPPTGERSFHSLTLSYSSEGSPAFAEFRHHKIV